MYFNNVKEFTHLKNYYVHILNSKYYHTYYHTGFLFSKSITSSSKVYNFNMFKKKMRTNIDDRKYFTYKIICNDNQIF